ncbi:MAG: GH25 family lysozyme [Saprospiraceae bacterium]
MKKSLPFFSFLTLLLLSCFACNNNDQTDQAGRSKNDSIPAIQAVTPPPAKYVYGLDLSLHQGTEIERVRKQQDKFAFIICKATEGITYTDPDFQLNWKTIPELGLIRGAYHFYRTKDAPMPQAENFASTIKDLQATDLPPIIDFEGTSFEGSKQQNVENIQKDILTFLQSVEKHLNRKPMIYTNNYIGNKYLNTPAFRTYALWIADYEAQTKPQLPKAWQGKNWLIWQKTGNYFFDGKKNDFDTFNGDRKTMEAFIKDY